MIISYFSFVYNVSKRKIKVFHKMSFIVSYKTICRVLNTNCNNNYYVTWINMIRYVTRPKPKRLIARPKSEVMLKKPYPQV